MKNKNKVTEELNRPEGPLASFRLFPSVCQLTVQTARGGKEKKEEKKEKEKKIKQRSEFKTRRGRGRMNPTRAKHSLLYSSA